MSAALHCCPWKVPPGTNASPLPPHTVTVSHPYIFNKQRVAQTFNPCRPNLCCRCCPSGLSQKYLSPTRPHKDSNYSITYLRINWDYASISTHKQHDSENAETDRLKIMVSKCRHDFSPLASHDYGIIVEWWPRLAIKRYVMDSRQFHFDVYGPLSTTSIFSTSWRATILWEGNSGPGTALATHHRLGQTDRIYRDVTQCSAVK